MSSPAQSLVTQVAANVNPFVGGKFDFDQIGFEPAHTDYQGKFSLEEIDQLVPYLLPHEVQELALLLEAAEQQRTPMPHQIVPWWRDDWEVMALNGGRGVGKTDCGSLACLEHLEGIAALRKSRRVDNARVGIGAPTNADARDVCMEGPAGLMTLYGQHFRSWNRSQGSARHKSGGIVKAMGTEKPARWNGPQWSFLWFDEASLCNRDSITQALIALRLGPREGPFRARALFTMTPKGQKWVEELLSQPTTYVPHYIRRRSITRIYRPAACNCSSSST
jgi:phage terminase large subunit-like protein